MTYYLRPYQQRVLDLLDYDAQTGVFTWKVPRKRNQVKAGSVAGAAMANGYVVIGIDGQKHYAHRLAWLAVSGEWPARSLDHIDGNKTNNAISNLRLASHAENAQNNRRPSSNTSGHTGVHWHKQIGKWHAYVTSNSKRVSAGCFERKEDAIEARRVLKAKLHAFNPAEVTR